MEDRDQTHRVAVRWAVGLGLILLAVHAGLVAGIFGRGDLVDGLAWSIYVALIAGAAAALLVRGLRREEPAWTYIGVGLAAWSVGEIYYEAAIDPVLGPYPSPADGLFIAFYVFALIGLCRLGGRVEGQPLVSVELVTWMLGLASIWSWLVFSPVLGTVEGSTAAVAVTLAYPLFDLVLLCSALLALAAQRWRPDRSLLALIAGITVTGMADSIYLVNVGSGNLLDSTALDSLWPAGALLMALAPWAGDRTRESHGVERERVTIGLGVLAIVIAVSILVADHFQPFNLVTVLLATATLIASAIQLVLLNRSRSRAQARGLEALHEKNNAEELYSAAAKVSPDAIMTADSEGRVRAWNDAAVQIFGFTREQALGTTYYDMIVPAAERDRERQVFEMVVSGRDTRVLDQRVERIALRADGSEFPVELSLVQVNTDPPMFTAFVRDISERRRADEINMRLAALVRSTGDAILSRDLLGIVTEWNEGATRLYGYTAEEAIGTPVGSLIYPADQLQEVDRLTARILDGDVAEYETKRRTKSGTLVDVSIRAFPLRDVDGTIGGVSVIAHDLSDRRRVEKAASGNREGKLWRGRIEKALQEDRFAFWGQPVVDLETGVIRHHELLLRMELDGGIVTPTTFLPHAESCDLIRQIDRWAVKRGIELAEQTPVAINLSAKSLDDGDLFNVVEEALGRSPVEPGDVTFEITETAAAGELGSARRLVEHLRSLGCDVALDDFGTGYGSFTYLKNLPVTELKIDVDFIRNLAEDPTDRRVVGSIVSVAHRFGMRTVAEGVEDEATLDSLRELNVDFVQGYHVGYPARMRDRKQVGALA